MSHGTTQTTRPDAARDSGSTSTGASTDAVTITGLTKRYGSVTAVGDLSLRIPAGSAFGLIGPNGAGKTTTMLCLATLLRPDAGTVRVFGLDPLTTPREVRRMVGWMPDFFGVYDDLSCREYLTFFAAAYRVPAVVRRSRVDDLLELVDLGHKADTDVAGLSRGMQQRLGLARTLVHDPQLLILDEPASGLDPRARIEMRGILAELVHQGRTLLISSHILSELGRLCDRVGIIESGRMLAHGTPAEIESRTAGTTTYDVTIVVGNDDAIERALTLATAAGAHAADATADGLRVVVAADAPVAADTNNDRDADVDRSAAGAEQAATVLRALVTGGIAVSSFAPRREDLEEVFMTVTEGHTR